MNPLATVREILTVVRERQAAQRDLDERSAIAKSFNDRYTYVRLYRDGQHAWMCPQCNRVHAPTEKTVWTGLQYPGCCSRADGHRLLEGIRTT